MKPITALLLGLAACGAAQAQDARTCISGTATLSTALGAQVPPGGTLFVYLREKGRDRGPPAAVISIKAPSYPQGFMVCGRDQMVTGAPAKALSGNYRLYARHSVSGAPMKDEGYLGTSDGAAGKGVKAGERVQVEISRPLAK